jgi:hypothetical protein
MKDDNTPPRQGQDGKCHEAGQSVAAATPLSSRERDHRKQSQLILFCWLSRMYPHWWGRPAHCWMLTQMLWRIIGEEARG